MTTATATREPITRSEALSEQELVRLKIARRVNQRTNDCDELIDFMLDTVRGEYPDAKHHHRQNAARDLAIMGGSLPQDTPGSAARVVREEDMPKPKAPKVTLKQIINKPIGAYIREKTDDCVDLIDEYYNILFPRPVFESANPDEKKYQKATRIRSHHKVAALREMMKRSIGSRNPYAYPQTSAAEEKMLNSKLGTGMRLAMDKGMGYARYMFEILENDKTDRYGNIITDPFTQSHRLIALNELCRIGADIPWEHITPEAIDTYFRDLHAKERRQAERLLAQRQQSANTELTPEQKAEVLTAFEEMQRTADANDRKAAKKAKKAEKKAAKQANANPGNNAAKDATKSDNNHSDADNKKHGNNNTANNGNGNNAATVAKDTSATGNSAANASADAPDTPTTRGETAIANALARHPEVDLDTALENHHATAGIPKQNLTHEQIYDAITAEANFQKRQAIIQNRLREKNPDAPSDDPDPKSRSP